MTKTVPVPAAGTSEGGRHRKVDVLDRLLSTFSVDQLELLADAVERVRERAVERRCDQSVTVTFNDKGYPRYCRASDDVPFGKPRE